MGGSNPYIQRVEYELPQIADAIRFLPKGQALRVDPARSPHGDNGLPGSVLDIALAYGIDIVIEISAWNRNLARE
ncbi:hypothetical protein [Gloeobacter violaceus]|uniref:Gsr3153 protein n=1 Tax=Gloeobacter violaceus (strain ATCC 29082 / PCC 7421) TaxID=251221 RepID=Q7NGL6_GLOVI|nr:hypothetical protein [Gloeobacter violaceus]BAC91094.1 gsr3153 [Gloeobacter violaceus PCC 7421]